MSKGCYTVGENANRRPGQATNDHSFRSFICALLIFLLICLVILLASISWGDKKDYANVEESIDKSAHKGDNIEYIYGTIQDSTKSHEKIRIETTTSSLFPEVTKMQAPTTSENSVTTVEDSTKSHEKIRIETTRSLFPEVTKMQAPTTSDLETTRSILVPEVTTIKERTIFTTLIETSVSMASTDATMQQYELHSSTTEDNSLAPLTRFPPFSSTTEKYTSNNFINYTTQEAASDITEIVTSAIGLEQTTSRELITVTATQISNTDIVQDYSKSTIDDVNSQELQQVQESIEVSTVLPATTIKEIHPTDINNNTNLLISSKSDPSSTTEVSVMESEFFTKPILLRMRSSPLTQPFDQVCESASCKRASALILSRMNHSAEPCDDFYEFSCGNYYQIKESLEVTLEEELHKISATSPKYLLDFKIFYESCVAYEDNFNYQNRLQGLENLLNEVGQFQFESQKEVDLTGLIASLVLRQSMLLFDIGVDVDPDSSNLILQLSLPNQSFLRNGIDSWSGLSLVKNRCLNEQKIHLFGSHVNLSNIYKLFENCRANYSAYLASVETVIRELAAFKKLNSASLLQEIKAIRFDIEFEVLNNLDTLPPSTTILSNFTNKKYDVKTIANLQSDFPLLDWKRFFRILTGRTLQDDSEVHVYFLQYFKELFINLKKVDKRKLNNAFLAIHSLDLFLNTVVPKEKPKRNLFCSNLAKQLMPDVWAVLVKGTMSVEEQIETDNLKKMFITLKEKFCRSIQGSEWIQNNAKEALRKCNNLNLITFSPNFASPINIMLKVNSDFQSSLINLLQCFRKSIYALHETKCSPDKIFSYFLDPLDSQPLTLYTQSVIAAPLGLMKKAPAGLPDYLMKILVGFPLAKQLARHFDPTGINYKLHLTSTSKSSYSEFVDTMKNLMDYSSPRLFHGRNISFYLDGTLSISERIIDNAALRLVFDSIETSPKENILPWISTHYSSEKVFFIGLAQEMCQKTSLLDFMLQVFEERHLPAVLRVENIIGSSEQFFKTFSCPDGSGMDFPDKIQFPFIATGEYDYEDENLEQNK